MSNTLYAQNSNADTLQVKIAEGDVWSYFKGDQKPPTQWYTNGFDDTSWQRGPSGFGYGIASNRTYLGDMKGNYSTVYVRREFIISNIYSVVDMSFGVVCDGPFVAYLDGIEMIRNDTAMPYTIDQATGIPTAEKLNVNGFIHELIPGKNILSVECTNDDINSDDFTFVPFFEVLEDQGGSAQ